MFTTYTSYHQELPLLLLCHSRNLATRAIVGDRLGTFLRSLEQVRLARRLATRRCLAARLPVRRLLVCCNVEHNEENQVRAEDNAASNGSIRMASAGTHMGEPGEMRACPVIPGGKVDNTWSPDVSDWYQMRTARFHLPRSITNWAICSRVIHSFHQILMPRAAWK